MGEVTDFNWLQNALAGLLKIKCKQNVTFQTKI